MDRKRLIDVAMGREPAEIVFTNGHIVNVCTKEVTTGDIAIIDGIIAGIGKYQGRRIIDVDGRYLLPGLIDSHVHIESSLVSPEQFARLVVPRGTTAVIADPHEIANVAGIPGIRYMLEASRELPLDIYYMLPSCVPSTPFENAGAVLDAAALEALIDEDAVLGLGEVMDYPSLLTGAPEVLAKIALVTGRNKRIDGHAPMVMGRELMAYRAAGVETDHECSTVEEMRERLRLGMGVLIREGSAARNLKTLIPAVTPENAYLCSFCTDDKQPEDILQEGHIDYNVRLAIEHGMDPLTAIQMATTNAARRYNLSGKGALVPGFDADILIVDDPTSFHVTDVYKKGTLVAQNGVSRFSVTVTDISSVTGSVTVRDLSKERLKLKLKHEKVNVIRLRPGDLITERIVRTVRMDDDGYFLGSDGADICKIAVIERHHGSGNIGLGLVEGFQLRGGAMATTIAHDSHNLIVVGDNDDDMIVAAEELIRCAGGMTACKNGEILGTLPLPIAGLMSDKTGEEVQEALSRLNGLVTEKLGVTAAIDPFMTLSFLALPVIPALKLTDLGLFDVTAFEFININEE